MGRSKLAVAVNWGLGLRQSIDRPRLLGQRTVNWLVMGGPMADSATLRTQALIRSNRTVMSPRKIRLLPDYKSRSALDLPTRETSV